MEKAIVKRNLVLKSPLDFYKILNNKEFIISISPLLIQFRDNMSLYINGCQCDSIDKYSKSLEIYKSIYKLDKSIIIELKKSIGCDMIIFKIDEKELFEI